MVSWQGRLLRVIFRLRRVLSPRPETLDVARNRSETEALASYYPPRVEPTCTPTDAGGVPAEWIDGPRSEPGKVILFLHGGAYNSGSVQSHRPLAVSVANAAHARVLLLDYRLAPEHPFPAAVKDTLAAYRWLLESGVAPGRIVVAGDSCGGGMVVALLVSLRDAGEPLPAAGVCLSPWTDLTCTGGSWETNASRELLIDPEPLRQAALLYLGDADPRTPLASPLFADLGGLPPLLIQVGSDELLLSDATGLAERAKAAGVDVTLEVWEGMQHEWQFAIRMLPEARQAVQRIGQFIQDRLR
jgi:acetyl esterase/lipase